MVLGFGFGVWFWGEPLGFEVSHFDHSTFENVGPNGTVVYGNEPAPIREEWAT
jgi:hypothetical protein